MIIDLIKLFIQINIKKHKKKNTFKKNESHIFEAKLYIIFPDNQLKN